jgi:hypothetical protein
MALTVPKPQIEFIKKLLELPDDKIAGFLEALAHAGPQFNFADLSNAVLSRIELPGELVFGLVQVLGSLYLTKDAQNTPTEQFIDGEVFAALKRAGTFSPEIADAQWKKLRKFFIEALSLEDSVGTAAKTGPTLTQHERIFVSARILTDVRPIFRVNVSEKPKSAVVIHMLRMVYRNFQGERQEQFFALDSNDLRSFKALIDRAMKKEETLKALMADAKVSVLPPKESY